MASWCAGLTAPGGLTGCSEHDFALPTTAQPAWGGQTRATVLGKDK